MLTIPHRQALPYLLSLATLSSSQYCDPSPCRPTCQAPGSPCDPDGLWNCLTHSWQRCADGAWSVSMPCAEGTVCAPAGLTHDLDILSEDGDDEGFSPSTGLPGTSYGLHSVGGAVSIEVHARLALVAFLVHSWVIADG